MANKDGTMDFNEILLQIGKDFMKFCEDPNDETLSALYPYLGALENCYEDPELLFEDDNCPAQIEVFMEALMDSIIHYKDRLRAGGFLNDNTR